MSPSKPHPIQLTLQEWSRITPGDTPGLRNLTLTEVDRRLLQELARGTSLRVEEWRQGLMIETGSHIGTVTLSAVRLAILPKLPLDTLLAMVAYAFGLPDLRLACADSAFEISGSGFVDLLGLALLREVRGIIRRGLLIRYRDQREERITPRGRIDMRQAATRLKRMELCCEFSEQTTDHLLNQAIAGGLRLAATLVQNAELREDLRRIAERLFAIQRHPFLDKTVLQAARRSLDRRSRHYEPALRLVALLWQGSRLETHVPAGDVMLSSFLLDMNLLFERFLARHLQIQAPPGMEVISQEVRTDVFSYLDNPLAWRKPVIRPDLIFRYHGRTVAIGDAKYRDHVIHPPTTAELYQLTTYGLAYPMAGSREVLLFHPLGKEAEKRSPRLLFAPAADVGQVYIRLVGVPIAEILAGHSWWPLSR